MADFIIRGHSYEKIVLHWVDGEAVYGYIKWTTSFRKSVENITESEYKGAKNSNQ